MLKSPTGKFTKEAEKMSLVSFPVIDPAATGRNIMRLRLEQGLTVRDVQVFFGFEEPQAIYKWQSGKSLPTVDNLYALSALLDVRMDEILVAAKPELKIAEIEPQAEACGSIIFIVCFVGAVIELLVEFDDSIVNWRNTQNSRK
jgi:transcriptional regulator with XRE-family HTH domain